MDIVDLKIIKILLRNSRITYREIAKSLNLSVNAIHKRVKDLVEKKVIRKFTAFPNLSNLQGKQVLISGISEAKGITEIAKELGKHESVFFIGVTGGKHLLIDGEVKKSEDLKDYTSLVLEKAKIKNPFVSEVNRIPILNPEKYSQTDILILNSLKEDGRKTALQIAEETELSAKTVRKALKRMQEKNMVDFSIFWAPDSEKDIIGNFEIYLKKDQNINDETRRLMENYPNIVYFQTFKKKPNMIMITTWFDSSRKLQKKFEEFEAYGYDEVILRVIYSGHFFNTWRMNYFD